MKRRAFLHSMGRGALAAGIWPYAARPGLSAFRDAEAARPPGAAPGFRAWTWVHGGGTVSAREWGGRFARLRAAGIEAVLVSGGDTGALSAAARGAGLEFHRWIWTLNRNGDTWAQAEHPEWFMVSRNGESTLVKPPYVEYYKWVCPTREPVRAYLRGLVERIAGDDRIDGVHLDYIRYPDVILPVGLWAKYGLVQDREYPEFDFCYCDVCRATFEKQAGIDPLALPDPPADEAWRRFRHDSVTRLVSELAQAMHAHDRPITAAVFPTPSLARKLVRQAWDEWPVDDVFPMLYHSFYEEDLRWIGASVREGLNAGGAARLHAGLYLPDLDPEEMGAAMEIARHAGAAGVSFFEMGGLDEAHLSALAEVWSRARR